ncbi:MAG: hypothetical protein IJY39_01065 [Clostridia bacterium]|nr:hypothetical protein [Clostridia bacterium]
MDQTLINKLLDALSIFVQAEALSLESHRKKAAIKHLEEGSKTQRDYLEELKKESRVGSIITGAVLFTVGLWMTFACLPIPEIILTMFFVFSGFPIIFGDLLFAFSLKHHIKYKKEYNEKKQEYEHYITEYLPAERLKLQNEIFVLEDKVADMNYKIAQAVDFLPLGYQNFEAVVFLTIVLNNQRADNLKEAMNLYEEHCGFLGYLTEDMKARKLAELRAEACRILEAKLTKS